MKLFPLALALALLPACASTVDTPAEQGISVIPDAGPADALPEAPDASQAPDAADAAPEAQASCKAFCELALEACPTALNCDAAILTFEVNGVQQNCATGALEASCAPLVCSAAVCPY